VLVHVYIEVGIGRWRLKVIVVERQSDRGVKAEWLVGLNFYQKKLTHVLMTFCPLRGISAEVFPKGTRRKKGFL
jgi:hypothetical protein